MKVTNIAHSSASKSGSSSSAICLGLAAVVVVLTVPIYGASLYEFEIFPFLFSVLCELSFWLTTPKVTNFSRTGCLASEMSIFDAFSYTSIKDFSCIYVSGWADCCCI